MEEITKEIPHLIKLGFDRRICAFIEIARHPEGLTINELIPKLQCGKMSVWFHIKPLLENNLIIGRRMVRNGRKSKVFKATPYGINSVKNEMKPLCELFGAIEKEMVKNENGDE
jgi:predicted ArsR family transcriptional regulator